MATAASLPRRHLFLEVYREYHEGEEPQSQEEEEERFQLREAILRAAQESFGVQGVAAVPDVLGFHGGTGRAVLCCRARDATMVWATLSFVTTCGGRACRLRVARTAPFLQGLASNSRAFDFFSLPAEATVSAASRRRKDSATGRGKRGQRSRR